MKSQTLYGYNPNCDIFDGDVNIDFNGNNPSTITVHLVLYLISIVLNVLIYHKYADVLITFINHDSNTFVIDIFLR